MRDDVVAGWPIRAGDDVCVVTAEVQRDGWTDPDLFDPPVSSPATITDATCRSASDLAVVPAVHWQTWKPRSGLLRRADA